MEVDGGAADGSPMAGEGGDSAAVGPTAAHSGGSSSSIVDVVPGYAHPSLPCDGSAVACLVVTQRGDVVTVASSIVGGKDGSSAINAAVPFHRTTLSGLLSSTQGIFLGGHFAEECSADGSPRNCSGLRRCSANVTSHRMPVGDSGWGDSP